MRENLWPACRQGNELKNNRTHAEDPQTGELIPLFNPRTQQWDEHFAWNRDFTQIQALTSTWSRHTCGITAKSLTFGARPPTLEADGLAASTGLIVAKLSPLLLCQHIVKLTKGIDVPFAVRLAGFDGGVEIGKVLAAVIGHHG